MVIIILLALVPLGFGLIYLVGWLSASTQPVKIVVDATQLPTRKPLSAPPPVDLVPLSITTIEIIRGDRLRGNIQGQVTTIQLACVTVKPDPQSEKYGADRLRALVTIGEPQIYVRWWGTNQAGDRIAELWVSQYGTTPQLVPVLLAAAGHVRFNPEPQSPCPYAQLIQAAQAQGEQRSQPPPMIQLPAF
ncbi:MAG: hypothetical protein VKJ86_07925 [Synechococcus sp.]|nr:hypothetical protein [Synechococcus sp.]